MGEGGSTERLGDAEGTLVGEQRDVSASEEERQLRWKLDLQIVPLTLVIYTLSFLDRTNIGQARLQGLQEDLDMSFHDFQVALTILYVPYIIFELPSNLIIRKVGPARLIPLLLTIWGMVSCVQGTVRDKTGLYINRAFLGLVEAGVLPGLSVYLSFFYTPREMQLRQALYFSGASLSGSFNGLLAVAIGELGGRRGIAKWSWVMIIEGAFTTLFGIIAFFIMPNSINNAWWLTEAQRDLGRRRLALARHPDLDAVGEKTEDVGATSRDGLPDEAFSWSEVLRAFTDPFVWLMFCAGFCSATSIYGLSFFAPTIIKGLPLGLTSVQSQLLSVPPFFGGFLFSVAFAFFSDHLQWRYFSGASAFALASVGYLIALCTSTGWAQYAGLMVLCAGSFSIPPMLLTWALINVWGYYKRATAAAFLICATNSAGIAGTWLFSPQEAPRYFRGFGTNLALNIMGIVFLSLAELWVLRERRRRRHGSNDHLVEALASQGMSPAAIRAKLGDRHPGYHLEL